MVALRAIEAVSNPRLAGARGRGHLHEFSIEAPMSSTKTPQKGIHQGIRRMRAANLSELMSNTRRISANVIPKR